MDNVFDILMQRGYIKQLTHEEEIKKLLKEEKITFYIGFDPTADSLHIGHYIAMMFMAHMQKFGHKPIALIGQGTASIGDPSGRTDLRQMLTKEKLQENADAIKKQLEKFIDFSDGKAIIANNADWLLNLNYVEFLRDIGAHFSVNRMLAAECFKSRMENGLSFLEFNYMVMQGYDFLVLNRKYNCTMQLGGDDQWSNMIAGVDLIRKKDRKQAYAMTCTLLTNSEGVKMGKTAKGALWLDKEKTTPYDFYQYWRNIGDEDVRKCLCMLTFVPMETIDELCNVEGEEINNAKKVLAFEVTKIIHGEDEANKAKEAAKSLFSSGTDMTNVPAIDINSSDIGMELLDILLKNKTIKSKSEGRRLIEQNAMSIDDEKIGDVAFKITENIFENGDVLLKMGKKKYFKLVKVD